MSFCATSSTVAMPVVSTQGLLEPVVSQAIPMTSHSGLWAAPGIGPHGVLATETDEDPLVRVVVAPEPASLAAVMLVMRLDSCDSRRARACVRGRPPNNTEPMYRTLDSYILYVYMYTGLES